MKLQNDNLLRALRREPVDRTPIWMMRQAGRYLPEYLQLRKDVPDFIQFCQTPELCCEAALQPLARFDLDAAILFNDILTLPHEMGAQLRFEQNIGPVFNKPILTQDDVAALKVIDADDMRYVMEAVSQTKKALNGRVPLIGFAGSPWTMACYLVEGQGSKIWLKPRTMLYQQPELMHALLNKLVQSTIHYLNGQIEAGADAIMLFDTWGGVLANQQYLQFSLQYMQKIAAGLNLKRDDQAIPLVFFTKNAAPWLQQIAGSGCDGVGIDSTMDLQVVKDTIGDKVALQGNLDPCVLFSGENKIRQEVNNIMQIFSGSNTGHVFNLGHGIDKSTPIESVQVMISAVREFESNNK
jgi:uroporphyrinogen decarboxylase